MSALTGKAVLLTGASRGIGRALALHLGKEGARLALCGRDAEALAAVADQVERLGAPPPMRETFDLLEEAEVAAFFDAAAEQLGGVDILINNAGFNSRKAPLHDLSSDEFDAILGVNLKAPFILMQKAFHDMKRLGGGRVVNILSTVCHHDVETMGAYTAAKQALRALTGVFRKEARPHNIGVTAVYPGGTDTEFRKESRPDYMRPESVAAAIISILELPGDIVPHEFTFRPMVESNF